MSKRDRKRTRLAEASGVAERHEFSSGQIGHDTGSYAIAVSERVALGVDAVHACVTRLADAIAGGDVGEWRGSIRLDDSRLVRRPMATMFRREWLWQSTAILALYTVLYYRKLGRDSDGSPLSLVPIVPSRLSRQGDRILLDGTEEIRPDELIRTRRAVWPTLTEEASQIIRLAREAFAAAAAQSIYAADFWENGGAPVVQIVTDQPLTDTEAGGIRDRWAAARRDNPGKPAVLGKGAEAKPFGADLAAADAGASGDRTLASIARYFAMQPWMINAPSAAGSLVYSNTSAAGLDLVNYTLDAYRGPIQDAWSEALPGDYLGGRRALIGLEHLTRGTMLEQAQAYQIATGQRAWMRPTEVRPLWHLAPDPTMDLDPAGAPAPAIESIPGG